MHDLVGVAVVIVHSEVSRIELDIDIFFCAGTAVCFNHAAVFADLKSTDASCRSASKHT